MTCSTCARADCPLVGLVESCLDWSSEEASTQAVYLPVLACVGPYRNWEEVGLDTVTDAEIDADLAPLTHAECAARGLRHSSEDDHAEVTIESGDLGESLARNELYFSMKGMAAE